MSASKDKKKRQEERASGIIDNKASQEAEELARTRKKYRTVGIIVVALVAVAIVFCIVFGSNLLYNKQAAVIINGEKYSAADFNYFYMSEYNKQYQEAKALMGDYASMVMPSTSTPLREQIKDEDTGITWADFLQSSTFESMKEITMLCDEAEKAGFTLSEEDVQTIESEIANLGYYASYSGYSGAGGYLEYMYGKGMTEEVYRKNIEKAFLAYGYAEYMEASFEYDEGDVAEYYDGRKDDYDYITYRTFYIDGNAVEDDESTEEDETVSIEDAMASAGKIAREMKANIKSENDFVELSIANASENMKDYYENNRDFTRQSSKGSELSTTYKEWLLDPARKYGDIEVFEYMSGRPEELSEDTNYMENNGYYVVFYMDRDENNYNSVKGSYLQISPGTVSKTDYETDEEYAAAKEAAEKAASDKAEEMLKAWKDDEENFESLNELTSMFYGYASDSGTYEQINKNEVYSPIAEWLFAPERQEGDVGIVQVDYYGYYLLKFDGYGEKCSTVMAEKDMRATDYNEWKTEKLGGYSLATAGGIKYAAKLPALGG